MSKAIGVLSLIVGFGFGTSAALGQTLTTAQVLVKLDEKAKVFSTLDASISSAQVVHNFKHPATSGKIYIKKASSGPRYFWDVREPKEQRMSVLIDKGEATVYFPNTKTYDRRTVDPNNDVMQLLLIGFGVRSETLLKSYSAEVKGTEAVGAVKATVLELTSTSGLTSKFPKVTLWLDPQTWTPLRTRVAEQSKDYTDFTYTNIRLNNAVADSTFRLNIPKDAKKQ